VSLLLDAFEGGGGLVRVEVPFGSRGVAAVRDPRAFVRAAAGLAPHRGAIVLDDLVLTGVSAPRRWRAGLATVLSELPDDAGPSLLDVVLLGTRHALGSTAAVAAGTRRARSQLADAEAGARALAGRMGLSGLDGPVAAAPADARATADLARALLASPRALVWRRPEWLRQGQIRSLSEVLDEEGRRLGLAVLEVRQS
jgi:ABC-type branched-subunit amino acid transport system ATPase component